MNLLQALAVLAAGGINAVVGSGSLLTFPVLLAVGFPSVTANVSNWVGLVFGNVSASWGYARSSSASASGRSSAAPGRRSARSPAASSC
jgi:uncharacterized membrane protein YfcA